VWGNVTLDITAFVVDTTFKILVQILGLHLRQAWAVVIVDGQISSPQVSGFDVYRQKMDINLSNNYHSTKALIRGKRG
jgi:hypothetical protein